MVEDVLGGIGTIQGSSMQPTLNPYGSATKDRVFLNRLVKRFKRGDVVVVRSPERCGKFIVKRITALEGDWIQQRSGKVLMIPRGKCWLEGDNTDRSHDS